MSSSPLGDRLEQLLQVEKFPPPAGFTARAQVTDPGVYEQAAADPAAWWAAQARERLLWNRPFSSVLDDSNPPFYTWFADGTINASYNSSSKAHARQAPAKADPADTPRRLRCIPSLWRDTLPSPST